MFIVMPGRNSILKPVTHSDWAAPVVVVPKKDGKFRVCEDYKVVVNQTLEVDQYPLPSQACGPICYPSRKEEIFQT